MRSTSGNEARTSPGHENHGGLRHQVVRAGHRQLIRAGRGHGNEITGHDRQMHAFGEHISFFAVPSDKSVAALAAAAGSLTGIAEYLAP
jgi:hypothetical protein